MDEDLEAFVEKVAKRVALAHWRKVRREFERKLRELHDYDDEED